MKELSAFLRVAALVFIGAFLGYTLWTGGLVTDGVRAYLCFMAVCIIYLRQLNKE